MVPTASAAFRTLRKYSARRRRLRKERKITFSLFGKRPGDLNRGGVARTERSITNWCQPNKSGVARLDAYFDSNDRKYFITPQSVDAAITEELAKAAKHSEPSERFGTVPTDAGGESNRAKPQNPDTASLKELEQKIFDLQVLNAGKDFYIGQLKDERKFFLDDLKETNRRVGELETMLQLEAPRPVPNDPRRVHVVSESEVRSEIQ
jgi:hypothetical protein